ncbi:MAG: aromatic amino acid lyase, partial [Shewanella sp.]
MTQLKLVTHMLSGLFGIVLMIPNSYAETYILDGKSLTVETLLEAAKPGNDVKISEDGWARIKKSYEISIDATKHGKTVYGLNVNFGELKDQQIVNGDVTKEPMRSASIAFNERQMRIQAAGVGPFLADNIVKMSMIIRLNQMAAGLTGMTTDAANAFITLVNNDANPLIPSRGSMGLNDLAWPTHIGLALMGEWDINYKGKRRDSKEVLKELGMKPFRPFGLDGISILSNGNVSMAILVDAMKKADKIINYSPYLIAAGLETLNGNVSPFLWHSVEGKGMPKGHEASEAILLALKGSYLWDSNDERGLQDPLSFRSAQWTLATVLNEMGRLKDLVNIQINHTSDNPLVTIAGKSDLWYSNTPVVKHYAVNPTGTTRDYINSNSAFDFTQIALQTESTIKALAHLLHGSGWRVMQVDDSRRTH